jgi:hypothetical protein
MRFKFLFTVGMLFQYFAGAGQQLTTIISDQGKYELDFTDIDKIKWHFERSYQIVVRSRQDLDLLRNISIELDKETSESLIDASVMISHTQGIRDTIVRDSFKLQPYDALYSEYICQVSNLRLNDTIKVSYVTNSEPHTNLIRWSIQQSFPVLESKFQFLLPEGTVYHDHITNSKYLTTELPIDTTLRLGRVKVPLKGLSLTFRNIPASADEPFAPALVQTQPAVLLTITDMYIGRVELYMPTWSDQITDLAVSDYFGKQYRSRAYYKWLADKASDIINTRYKPKLHLLKLYEFVHQEFEWDGSYGLIPSHSLSDMRSGEKRVNKASMNMALLALLQETGFAAYPVLVTTTDQSPAYKEIPNLNQFNHFVIAVEVDRELVFLDAGDPQLPIGLIDNGINHSNAVLIKNYKGAWIEIPDFESKSIIAIVLKVHDDLSASGTIKANFEGYDAFNERHLLQADPNALYWKERGLALSPDIRIDSVRFDNVRNLLMPFENVVYFHIEPSSDQEELAFNPIFYSFFNQVYFTDSTRVNDVLLPSKIVEKVVFNAILDNLTVKSMPESINIRMVDNSSEMSYKTSEQLPQLGCVFDIVLNKPEIGVGTYPALKVYLEQVYQKLTEQIVIGR